MEFFKSQYVLWVVLVDLAGLKLNVNPSTSAEIKGKATVPDFLKKMNTRYDHVLCVCVFLNDINKTWTQKWNSNSKNKTTKQKTDVFFKRTTGNSGNCGYFLVSVELVPESANVQYTSDVNTLIRNIKEFDNVWIWY